MKINIQKLKLNKGKIIKALLIFAIFFFPTAAVLADSGWVTTIIGGLAQGIASVLGWILVKIMGVLIQVAQYNSFIKSAAIVNGWVISRDIANMFFILILLIIAFATILRIESYSYKKWLPKLILMAILINFSKTICGLLIDLSQVVMLTFVNAFKDVGAGSLVDMLGVTKWQSLDGIEKVDSGTVASAYVLSVIYVVVTLITVTAMLGMLVMRIIMIWVYVVISPFAYLLAAFPGGAKYSSQWWSEFIKNLIVGPVLAFFIWLSFTSLVSFNTQGNDVTNGFKGTEVDDISCEIGPDGQCKFGTSDLMIKFIVAIAMLLGGMTVAQQIGGQAAAFGGSIAKKGTNLALGTASVAGGLLGYDFAKRRYKAWRGEVKERMQQNSDIAYERIKGGISGTVKGGLMGLDRKINGPEDPLKRKAREEEKDRILKAKDEKREIEKARRAAYETGEYKGQDGKVYKYDETSKQYKNGSDVAKDSNGNVIKKMSDFKYGFKSGMSDSMTKAQALKNQISDGRMSKEQKIFDSAGTGVQDLKRIMDNTSESKDKRQAAALQLAIKEGFKNADLSVGRQDVQRAKSLIGDNAPLLSKFNDQINKRHAALNYNLDDKSGREAYKAAMASGSIDGYKQDASSYKNKNVVKTLRDYSGKDFGDNYNRMMSQSGAHNQFGMEGLMSAKNDDLIETPGSLFNSATGEINPYAKILAANGDMMAFNNTATPGALNWDGTSEAAMTKFMETAKGSILNNFNNDYLNETKLTDLLAKKGITASAYDVKNTIKKIQSSIGDGLDVTTVANAKRADQNPEFVRRYVGIIKKKGPGPKWTEIEHNNVLKNISPINPV